MALLEDKIGHLLQVQQALPPFSTRQYTTTQGMCGYDRPLPALAWLMRLCNMTGPTSSRPAPRQRSSTHSVHYVTPPVAPEVAWSPTVSVSSSQTLSSSQSHSSSSGNPSSVPRHWAIRVFDGRHSSTRFLTAGNSTLCFGRDEPVAEQRLMAEGFLRVLQLYVMGKRTASGYVC